MQVPVTENIHVHAGACENTRLYCLQRVPMSDYTDVQVPVIKHWQHIDTISITATRCLWMVVETQKYFTHKCQYTSAWKIFFMQCISACDFC